MMNRNSKPRSYAAWERSLDASVEGAYQRLKRQSVKHGPTDSCQVTETALSTRRHRILADTVRDLTALSEAALVEAEAMLPNSERGLLFRNLVRAMRDCGMNAGELLSWISNREFRQC